ncbi:MAG: hypothetical protein SFY80_11235 [Verrucomicrobiota bacterium]|nr:hypothetical protein [Verrucomicrobiota bacterium]
MLLLKCIPALSIRFRKAGLLPSLFGTLVLAITQSLPAATMLPSGQDVVGEGEYQPTGNVLYITQYSPAVIVNWADFGIGAGNGNGTQPPILLPTDTAVMLARILGANPGEIYGTLKPNGPIYLINTITGEIFGGIFADLKEFPDTVFTTPPHTYRLQAGRPASAGHQFSFYIGQSIAQSDHVYIDGDFDAGTDLIIKFNCFQGSPINGMKLPLFSIKGSASHMENISFTGLPDEYLANSTFKQEGKDWVFTFSKDPVSPFSSTEGLGYLDGFGFFYDGFYPFVWSWTETNWIYVQPTAINSNQAFSSGTMGPIPGAGQRPPICPLIMICLRRHPF